MSKHAPRGPVKVHTDPIQGEEPLQKALLAPGAARCTARGKHSKRPCKNPAIAGGFVCRMHGGSAPQVKMAARERLMNLQPLAIQTLHNLLHREEFPTVQLGAAKDVLDRTEGKAAESLHVMGADNGPLRLSIEAPWLKPPS